MLSHWKYSKYGCNSRTHYIHRSYHKHQQEQWQCQQHSCPMLLYGFTFTTLLLDLWCAYTHQHRCYAQRSLSFSPLSGMHSRFYSHVHYIHNSFFLHTRKKNTKLRIFYGANKRNDAWDNVVYPAVHDYITPTYQSCRGWGGAHIITMYIVMMVSFCAVFQLNTNKKQN